jgi:hypothetical protein
MPLPTHIVSLITTAWEDGYPLLLAVNGPDGPVMGPKGSMIVFDGEHLAYLERTRGAILDCLKRDPRVCLMYVNMKAQRDGKMDSGFLRFFGTAELYESGPMREAIFARLHKREQEHVGADKGIGVLIRITSAADIRGKTLG